jgi:hypothetical protein
MPRQISVRDKSPLSIILKQKLYESVDRNLIESPLRVRDASSSFENTSPERREKSPLKPSKNTFNNERMSISETADLTCEILTKKLNSLKTQNEELYN